MVDENVNVLLQACGIGNLDEVVRLLLEGASPDASNAIGYTPLMSACSSHRVEVIEELLKREADPNRATDDGLTTLHYAVGSTPSQPDRQAKCVQLLLTAGAEPDCATDTGMTPLMNAAWFGCVDAAQVLLSHPVDVSKTDNQGRAAYEFAKSRKHVQIATMIETATR